MLNKWTGMGRMVKDPELRFTQNNTEVVSFTLAVGRNYSPEGQPKTDFIDIVAFGKTAVFVNNWFHKGLLVAVAGRLQVRNWEDKEGSKRKSVEIIAEEVHFAEKKKDDKEPAGGDFTELMEESPDLPF